MERTFFEYLFVYLRFIGDDIPRGEFEGNEIDINDIVDDNFLDDHPGINENFNELDGDDIPVGEPNEIDINDIFDDIFLNDYPRINENFSRLDGMYLDEVDDFM